MASNVESEVVDFKEEAGTVLAGGLRVPIDPQHEQAAKYSGSVHDGCLR